MIGISHLAGRYDAEPHHLQAAFENAHREGSTVVGFTEVAAWSRRVALRRPGWDVQQHDDRQAGESAVASWAGVWHAAAFYAPDVTSTSFFRRGGSRVDVHPATSVLVSPSRSLGSPRRVLSVTEVHMPAHVQKGDGWRGRTARVRAYQSAVRGLRRHLRQVRRQHDPGGRVVLADWNLDLKRRRWRMYLRVNFPGFRVAAPREGTHGHRAIDGALIGRRLRLVGKVRVGPKTPASDHRPIHFTVAWRRP